MQSRRAALGAAVLGALGAWASVIPYVGPLLGLHLKKLGVPNSGVDPVTEVVDHVVPGVLVVAVALLVLVLLRTHRVSIGSPFLLAAMGLSFLAGVWITATHVPLLVEAARGSVAWGPALLHNSGGIPLVILALALLVPELREPDQAEEQPARP
jgi:hypothetical protein